MTEFTTVFEIGKIAATEQPPLVVYIVGGALSLVAGISIVVARFSGKLLHLKRHTGPFFIVFGIGWLAATPFILLHWEREALLEKRYIAHEYNIVEGVVSVLRIQPKEGHAPGDLIKIGDREFEIN